VIGISAPLFSIDTTIMTTSTSADEQFQIAVRAHQSGDLAAAERAYRATLAIDPAHSASSNNLGLLLAMTDRLDAAIASFEQALCSDPRSADASVNLAQALQQAGRHPQALQQWQHASELLPRQMDAALSGALLAMQIGDPERAMDLLDKAAQGVAVRDEARATLINAASELGATRLDAGELADAHRMAGLLTRVDPHGDTGPRMLERCLRNAQVREFDAGIKDDVLCCYRSDAVDHRQLARISAQLLLAQYPLLRAAAAQSSLLQAMTQQGVHRDPLLLALLN